MGARGPPSYTYDRLTAAERAILPAEAVVLGADEVSASYHGEQLSREECSTRHEPHEVHRGAVADQTDGE